MRNPPVNLSQGNFLLCLEDHRDTNISFIPQVFHGAEIRDIEGQKVLPRTSRVSRDDASAIALHGAAATFFSADCRLVRFLPKTVMSSSSDLPANGMAGRRPTPPPSNLPLAQATVGSVRTSDGKSGPVRWSTCYL